METSDTFEASSYPLPIRIINGIGKIFGNLGIRTPLSADRLLDQAIRKTRLSDFGDDGFEEPLSVLLEAIENEASLNTLGRFMARQMIVSALINRLRIQAECEQRPEYLATPIDRPLFILGYPRTGTTLLQNLLALDPSNRTLKMFESLSPVAPHSTKRNEKDPRIELAKKFIKATHYISAQVPVIHALNAEGPDECLKLIENTFVSPHFLLYFHVPGYWRWLLNQDIKSFVPVYEYHRQQLRLISKGQADLRWVLKAPVHLFFLDSLLKVYPDASVVFLHRDPQAAIPSFSSLLAVSRAMASDRTDLTNVGDFALDLYEHSYVRASQAIDAAARPGQIYDIDYRDLLNDPIGTVKGIYDHFSYTPDPGLEQSITYWLAHNPQHKHGVHRYSMEKFGLNPDRIRRATERSGNSKRTEADSA